MTIDKPKKLHIISFRVTEDQLLELQARANALKTKINKIIVEALFK
jgi:hypothetical protein